MGIASVETKLAEAATSEKCGKLWDWARQALQVPSARVAMTFEARDPERLGTLSTTQFHSVLKELAPDLPSDQLMALVLLLDMTEHGDIAYAQCMGMFGVN